MKKHRRLPSQPYEPGAEPSCSISALSARARQCGIRLQPMNLSWAARSARSELRADWTTTDVIVNGSPRTRVEKLTRYMHPPARDTSVVRPDAGREHRVRLV